MIDVKTRKKILKLKKEGHTNTEIKRMTDISFPSIRKILREEGFDNAHESASPSDSVKDYLGELDERLVGVERSLEDVEGWIIREKSPHRYVVHEFVLNFIRVLPAAWARGNVWKVLSQGVAPWRYASVLGAIVENEIVSAVEQQLQAFEPVGGKVFGVEVTARDGMYSVNVNLLFAEG